MSNPESRVIMIGNKQQLQRVQAIFKESMFGPDPDQLYIDEEICPERKELGYHIDFISEKAVLAFKGNPPASFIVFLLAFFSFSLTMR
jgi:hypothetical protein